MDRENTCPSTEADLTAYCQGELSPDRGAAIEAHLADCAGCRHALEGVRSIFTMAGTVEDIVPSLRMKTRIARLLDRNRVAPVEPLGERVRLAVAYLLDRLRTSRGFRGTAVSVVANAAILLLASLVVLPAVAPKNRAEFIIDPDSIEQLVRKETGPFDPVGVDPLTANDVEPRPLPHADDPFQRDLPPEMVSLDPLLPPAEAIRRRPGVIIANVISPERKRSALAASFADAGRAVASVDQGLAWLAGTQKKDGSWPSSARGPRYGTGVTASALLAFLSDGHSETRGRKAYRPVVRKGIDWLLGNQVTKGELEGLVGPAGKEVHYTYNQAIATLALVEAYSLDHRRVKDARAKRLKEAVRRAVSFAVRTQTPDGGWKYRLQAGNPARYENDTSVSIFMVTALAAARSARFHVPKKSFRGFARWLRHITGENGVVGYARPGDRDDEARTLTAGALFLEERLGLAAPLRDRQAKLVRAELADPKGSTRRNCLLRFFASLAFRLRGEPVLHTFGAALLEAQQADGSWRVALKAEDADLFAVHGGDAFLTAINVLTLTTAYRAGT